MAWRGAARLHRTGVDGGTPAPAAAATGGVAPETTTTAPHALRETRRWNRPLLGLQCCPDVAAVRPFVVVGLLLRPVTVVTVGGPINPCARRSHTSLFRASAASAAFVNRVYATRTRARARTRFVPARHLFCSAFMLLLSFFYGARGSRRAGLFVGVARTAVALYTGTVSRCNYRICRAAAVRVH